jgi:catechol 2,3-dioxygenase-like lactoylglutathione lyase family enzyme
MIDHTGVNVSDFELGKAFYVQALAPLGYGICLELEGGAGFGANPGERDDPGGDFWISAGEPQTPCSHLAFRAAGEGEVQAFYSAAIAAGGKDNGPPGERPHYHSGYYAAYVLDPDGHNIEAVYHGAAKKDVEP